MAGTIDTIEYVFVCMVCFCMVLISSNNNNINNNNNNINNINNIIIITITITIIIIIIIIMSYVCFLSLHDCCCCLYTHTQDWDGRNTQPLVDKILDEAFLLTGRKHVLPSRERSHIPPLEKKTKIPWGSWIVELSHLDFLQFTLKKASQPTPPRQRTRTKALVFKAHEKHTLFLGIRWFWGGWWCATNQRFNGDRPWSWPQQARSKDPAEVKLARDYCELLRGLGGVGMVVLVGLGLWKPIGFPLKPAIIY